jgi:integrase
VLTPDELTQLQDAADSTRERAWLLLTSKWGLRASEAAHVNPAWVSTQQGTLTIPSRCRCPTCQDGDAWDPKTNAGARTLPLMDHDPETWAAVLAYVQDYGHDPCSRQAVGKAVNRLADRALLEANVYPHALRATAAQQLADAGLTAHRLCRVLGWKDARSARPCVDASRAQVDRALEDAIDPWWNPAGEPSGSEEREDDGRE